MERERITISIKKDILHRIDETVDGVVVRNRSHALEHLITQVLAPNKAKDAVILIGGKNAAKLIPNAREAIIKLRDAGFSNIHIALGYLAESAKKQFGEGGSFGVNIEYLEEGEGTGGALLPLKKKISDTFVVINPGDALPEDINKVIRFHQERKQVATVATNDLSELKGLYVFEKKIFDYLPDDFSMLENDIFPKLVEKNQLAIYPLF